MKSSFLIVTVLVAAAAVFGVPIAATAQTNDTASDSIMATLIPGGGAQGLIEPGEKVFVLVCPPTAQTGDDCQVLQAQ